MEQGKSQHPIRSPQVVAREFARAAIDGRVVPFAAVKLCPACMAHRAAATMHYENGTVQPQSRPGCREPYLRVTCGVCKFSWSEAPAWTL
jgi:hypothetical protein